MTTKEVETLEGVEKRNWVLVYNMLNMAMDIFSIFKQKIIFKTIKYLYI